MISSSSSSSDEDADDNDMMIFMYLKKHTKLFIDRKPCRTSILGGKEYLRELVCGNPIQCYELFRMKPHVFLNLCDKLKLLGLLQDSRNVSVEEGLAMTLRILCHGNTQREVSDRFQHSTGTVHYWFKTVLRALKAFALTVVKPVDRGVVQPEILANSRWYPFFKERLEYIEMDQREYTLDDDDRKVQDVIMKPVPSISDADILKKSLSYSYPHLPFNKAIQKESEKLHVELQHSQANLDVGQCEVIQHLIEVTEVVVASKSVSAKMEPSYLDVSSFKENQDESGSAVSRSSSSVTSRNDLLSTRGSYQHEEWHSDLLGCCSEPMMCIKTFLFPCGTFSKIATVATGRHTTSAEACNELMAYSLILSCCCYTCCIRRKLRKTLNITGGWCDDFLSHFMCCCCALVQELREVEMQGIHGPQKSKTSPPPCQYMEH